MRALKIVSIVVGALIILVGLSLFLPGGFLLWAHETQRDEAGYYHTSARQVVTDRYALTTPEVTIHIGSDWNNWFSRRLKGLVRLQVESQGNAPIFVGIGPSREVDAYLLGVAHDEMIDFTTLGGGVRYRRFDGDAPATPPQEQDFWVVSVTGSEVETLDWDVSDGDWTAVIMNADGSAGIEARASIGAKLDIIFPIAIGILIAGFLALAIGIVLVILGARRSRPAPTQYPGGPTYPGQPPYPGTTTYPGQPPYPGQASQPGGSPPGAYPQAGNVPSGYPQQQPPTQPLGQVRQPPPAGEVADNPPQEEPPASR